LVLTVPVLYAEDLKKDVSFWDNLIEKVLMQINFLLLKDNKKWKILANQRRSQTLLLN
jgi:hypothetical protein